MCVHAQFLSHIHLFVTYEQQPARIPCPWGFSGKNTGVGCHFLLQEIFPTEGSNPHLLHQQAVPLKQADASVYLKIISSFPQFGTGLDTENGYK